MAAKIGVISLGCAKNRVDTEAMLGILEKEGYEFVQDMLDADIMLINTCAFTNDAKEESINTILESEQQRKFGDLKGIIVTGCLPQRFQNQLNKLLPRVDCFLGVAAYQDVAQAVKDVLENQRYNKYAEICLPEQSVKRVITTPKPTAYVKIAEGCDNNCTYCVIPSIRGRYQSRPMENILEEIEQLTADGYSEIILISQDSTRYGMDLYGKPSLAALLDKAAQIEGVHWLRALYFYPDPEFITDELLEVMVKHDNIMNYIEMPVQHMENEILKDMGRRNTYESTVEIVERIRNASPDFVIRTTAIVGFPGAERTDISVLSKRLKEAMFDHLGVFTYSQEEGTPAADMPNQLEEAEKEFRRDAVLNMQTPVSLMRNRERVGKIMEVLIEGKDENSDMYYGRTYAQIPEVDGKVFVRAGQSLTIGNYYYVKIKEAYNYDCIAELADGEVEN